MELIDSHVHLDDPAFDADRDLMVQRARDAGVIAMVTVGTTLAGSRAAVALAERYPEVYAAVAVHPHDAGGVTEDTMAALRALADHPKVVAVGETGLDFARPRPIPSVQEQVFRWHIDLSLARHLPLIVHCRDAYPAVLDILEERRATTVIMHAFSGSLDVAQDCAARGYVISLAGPVTFRNARIPVEVTRALPVSALLVETDAPVLAPVPFRGRRNEPAFLRYTVARIADVKGMAEADVAQATVENARRIFLIGTD